MALIIVDRRRSQSFSSGTSFGDGSALTKTLTQVCFACRRSSRDAQAASALDIPLQAARYSDIGRASSAGKEHLKQGFA